MPELPVTIGANPGGVPTWEAGMEVICIRCKGQSVRIVSVDDKAARVECLSCGKEFHAETQAAVEAMRLAAVRRGG
jgi:hypothetical protein